jgi:lysophospholipase L1-like esterase
MLAVLAGSILAAAMPAGAASPLKAGDRVVFLGDSITQQMVYTRYVMNYFTLRYPGLDVTFRNAGWGGDSAPGGLGRLQRDVLSLKPTVVTICFGMNDGGYRQFDPKAFEWYMKGMTGLVAELKKAGARVILLTPGCVDTDRQPALKQKDYNDTLKRFGEGVKTLADQEKVAFFNLHDLMIDVQTKAKAKDPKYTMIPDSVHPNEPGQAVMAYAVLKALGCEDPASALVIDAAGASPASQARPENCTVQDMKCDSDSITFTRTDAALPTYLDPAAASTLDYFPFTQDLNQYNFQVAGLKDGNWKLTVEGIDVGTFSKKDLGAGLNLATLPGPWQKLGEEVNKLSREQETLYFFAWRQFVPQVPVPEPLKADWEAITKKADGLVEQAEAARLKTVPAARAWKWSLTRVP